MVSSTHNPDRRRGGARWVRKPRNSMVFGTSAQPPGEFLLLIRCRCSKRAPRRTILGCSRGASARSRSGRCRSLATLLLGEVAPKPARAPPPAAPPQPVATPAPRPPPRRHRRVIPVVKISPGKVTIVVPHPISGLILGGGCHG